MTTNVTVPSDKALPVSNYSLRHAYTEASPMADESTTKDLDIKFRTAYLIAIDEMSFTAFLSPVKLQKRNGLPITDSYCSSDVEYAKMIAEIAAELE